MRKLISITLLLSALLLPLGLKRQANEQILETKVLGEQRGLGADFGRKLECKIFYPKEIQSSQSSNIGFTYQFELSSVGRRIAPDHIKFQLHGSSFEISPSAQVAIEVIKETESGGELISVSQGDRIQWNIRPKADTVGIQELFIEVSGLDFRSFDRPSGTNAYTLAFEENGKERNSNDILDGYIPIRLSVISKYGIPYGAVWSIQAVMAFLAFVVSYPVLTKFLETRLLKRQSDQTS